MAAHLRHHAIAAAAVTTAVLLATRWWAARAAWAGHDAEGVGTPGPRADRVADLHAAYLEPALRETDAHLERYWNKITSLYLHREHPM